MQEVLKVEWLLETHAHADHRSATPYLQEKLVGELVGAFLVARVAKRPSGTRAG